MVRQSSLTCHTACSDELWIQYFSHAETLAPVWTDLEEAYSHDKFDNSVARQ